MNINKLVTLFSLIILNFNLHSDVLKKPTSYSKDLYPEDILVGNYNSKIDRPEQFIDFGYGERVASPSQISNAINAWGKQSSKLNSIFFL